MREDGHLQAERRGHGPLKAMTLDVWPPELRQYISIVQAIPSLVLCYASPSKLIPQATLVLTEKGTTIPG